MALQFVLRSLPLTSLSYAYTHVALAAAISTEVVWNKVDVRQRLPLVEPVVSQERTFFKRVRFQN